MTNRRVQLEIGADASNLRENVTKAAQAASDAIQGIGKSADDAAKNVERNSNSIVAAMKRQATETQKAIAEAKTGDRSSAAFFEEFARQKKVDVEAIRPLLTAIAQLRSEYNTLQAQQKQTAGSDAFLTSLKQQAEAIGKTRSELAAMQAARLGLSTQAEPFIAKLRESETALKKAGIAFNEYGLSAKQTTAALRQVPAQITDIVVSLQGGQAPLTVLLQQGGQLRDVFGGIVPAAKALGGALLGLINPYTAVAAAIGTIAFGFLKGQSEAQTFEKTLITTGNAAGVSAGQLQQMAKAIGTFGSGGQAKASEALNTFAQSGRIGAENLQRFTKAAIDLERAGGAAIKDTAKAFEDLAKEPLKAVLSLNEAQNFLTRATYEQIKALEEQGKTVEAAKVAQEAFFQAATDRAPQLVEQLGYVSLAYQKIADAAKAVKNAILDIGRPQNLQEQADELRASIERRGQGREFRLGGLGGMAGIGQADRRNLEADKQKLASLNEELGLERQIAKVKDEQGEAVKARAAFDRDHVQRLLPEQEKRTQAILRVMNEGLAVAAKGGMELAQVQVQVQREIAKWDEKTKTRGKSEGEKALERQARLLQELSGLTSTFNQDLADLYALKQRVNLSDEQYNKLLQELLQKQPVYRDALKAEADAAKELAKALDEAVKVRAKYLGDLEKTNEKQAEVNQKLADEIVEIVAGKDALAQRVALRLEEQAIQLEIAAQTEYQSDLDERAFNEQMERVRGLRAQAGLMRGKQSAEENRDLQKANKKAAEDALKEWEKTSDQISQSLADALMDGGKKAADYIKDLFRTMVLQPVIKGVVSPFANATLGILGMGAPGMAAANAAGAGGSATSILGSLSSIASVAGSLGVLAKTGVTLTLAGNTAGAIASAGAMANAGMYGSAAAMGIGAAAPYLLGAYALYRGLSRGPAQVQGEFLRGEVGAGGFDLRTDVEMMRKGGFLRSDKRWTDSTALTGALDSTLDKAAADVRTTIEKYGSALALPVEKLAEVTASINVKLGGSAEDMQKALGDALTQYADALGAKFADVIAPLQQWGESTVQTMERVSLALTTVNEVMKSLGMDLLESSSASVVSAAGAAAELANKFGGLQNLTSLSGAYYEAFYDDAERAARSTQRNTQLVTDAFAEVGVALPESRAAFRELVTGLDLTTEAGQEQFVTLMKVAGAFAELNPLTEDAASNIDKFAENFKKAMQSLEDDADNLQVQLLRATGNESGASNLEREQFLASQDVSASQLEVIAAAYDYNIALKDQIAALENASQILASLAGETSSLDTELLRAAGNETEARKIEREQFIDGLEGIGEAQRDAIISAYDYNIALRDQVTALENAAAAAQILASLTDEKSSLEIEFLRTKGNEAEAARLERQQFIDGLEGIGDAQRTAIIGAYDYNVTLRDQITAYKDAANAANDAANAAKAFSTSLDQNLRRVLTPEQARVYETEQLGSRLRTAGVWFSTDDLLGASRQQILDFAKAFIDLTDNSVEAKTAVVEVAGALFDLRKAADQAALEDQIGQVEKDIKALTDVFGDLANLDPIKTITEQFAEGVSELERLENGLATILGTVAKTIQETLADMIASQRSLQQFRGGLADAIEEQRLGAMSPSERVAALRATEATLFAQLGSASDPVAVAGRLQRVILDRVQAEVALRESGEAEIARLSRQARDDQIDTLRSQIDAFERLRDLSNDIKQLTGSLLFSDISPLNPEQQLSAAQELFAKTAAAARAGDEFAQGTLTRNAQALLDEARSFYASSAGYSNIFSDVLRTLDEIGALGSNADPQIAALEAQLEELRILNDSQESVVQSNKDVYDAFILLDNALAQREEENKNAIEAQTGLARQQIAEQKLANEKLDAQIKQAAATYEGLIKKLDELNENLDILADNADLVGARP